MFYSLICCSSQTDDKRFPTSLSLSLYLSFSRYDPQNILVEIINLVIFYWDLCIYLYDREACSSINAWLEKYQFRNISFDICIYDSIFMTSIFDLQQLIGREKKMSAH